MVAPVQRIKDAELPPVVVAPALHEPAVQARAYMDRPGRDLDGLESGTEVHGVCRARALHGVAQAQLAAGVVAPALHRAIVEPRTREGEAGDDLHRPAAVAEGHRGG